MSLVQRFGAYAAAFEEAFKTDDWSLIEPYFTENAVYETVGDEPLGGVHHGRDRVLAHLEESVNTLDRRFDARELELLEGPTERGDSVWIRWRAAYRVEGAPPYVMEGEETATFEGDRIARLEDRFAPGAAESLTSFLKEHASKLKPA